MKKFLFLIFSISTSAHSIDISTYFGAGIGSIHGKPASISSNDSTVASVIVGISPQQLESASLEIKALSNTTNGRALSNDQEKFQEKTFNSASISGTYRYHFLPSFYAKGSLGYCYTRTSTLDGKNNGHNLSAGLAVGFSITEKDSLEIENSYLGKTSYRGLSWDDGKANYYLGLQYVRKF